MAETDVLDEVVATSPEGLREQALRRPITEAELGREVERLRSQHGH